MRLAALAIRVLLTVGALSLCLGDKFDKNDCDRDCTSSSPKPCEYELKIETYATMSKACHNCPHVESDCSRKHCVTADGVKRQIYTVNRELPSPQIRVCEGDTIVALVINDMSNGEGTSIHWHGVHQNNTAYMDGVAMITQCPILPYNMFVYNFTADKPGTHYYHSHVGMQRGDGIAGALVVKSRDRRFSLHYDLAEHTIIVQDWYHKPALVTETLHLHAMGPNAPQFPEAFIINGAAPFNERRSKDYLEMTRYSIFNVAKNYQYRFRIINNAVLNCPIQIYVEKHKLRAIATDGADIALEGTDNIVVSGGERWDFVIATTEESRNYWIVFQGVADCENVTTYAILHYEKAGTPDVSQMTNPKNITQPNYWRVNPFNEGMVSPDEFDTQVILSEMISREKTPDWLSEGRKPDKKLYLMLGLSKVNNDKYNEPTLYPCWEDEEQTIEAPNCTVMAQINHISGVMPNVAYISQHDALSDSKYEIWEAESDLDPTCKSSHCKRIHRLKVNKGDIVEFVLIDEGKYFNLSNHPMHIHGQYFYVLSVGQFDKLESEGLDRDEVIRMDEEGLINRTYDRPIKKDTIMMPTRGYVVVRFKAENPGPWLFHCHNELHVEQGMFMVIEVGEPESWPQNPTPLHPCGPVKEVEEISECSGKASGGWKWNNLATVLMIVTVLKL